VVTFYVPEGRWTHFLTGAVVAGPGWRTQRYGYDSLPLLARPGSIIAVGADQTRPDYDYADGVVFQVFEMAPEAAACCRLHGQDGGLEVDIEVRRNGEILTVHARGARRPWGVQLRNVSQVHAVEGATQRPDPAGVLLLAEAGTERISARL
jgi:alpha-D-xyloside xylohydrolase